MLARNQIDLTAKAVHGVIFLLWNSMDFMCCARKRLSSNELWFSSHRLLISSYFFRSFVQLDQSPFWIKAASSMACPSSRCNELSSSAFLCSASAFDPFLAPHSINEIASKKIPVKIDRAVMYVSSPVKRLIWSEYSFWMTARQIDITEKNVRLIVENSSFRFNRLAALYRDPAVRHIAVFKPLKCSSMVRP